MSCPTCDHTMQGLLPAQASEFRQFFWCPRCGTLKTSDGEREEIESPLLVELAESIINALHKVQRILK